MEDELNFMANGRQPKLLIKDNQNWLMEDDVNFRVNGRWPQVYFINGTPKYHKNKSNNKKGKVNHT